MSIVFFFNSFFRRPCLQCVHWQRSVACRIFYWISTQFLLRCNFLQLSFASPSQACTNFCHLDLLRYIGRGDYNSCRERRDLSRVGLSLFSQLFLLSFWFQVKFGSTWKLVIQRGKVKEDSSDRSSYTSYSVLLEIQQLFEISSISANIFSFYFEN